MERYVQRDLPPGVPPLELDGERTLPDIPVENYWFRRHLVVYEWIARRVAGADVVDLCCGEGYGPDLLANAARSVVGVEVNERVVEHARLRYRRANLRFACTRAELYAQPCDVVVMLQAIEHLRDPDAALRRIGEMIGPDGVAYVSTPNVLTFARGADRSDNPFHHREYRPSELNEVCRRHFESVELLGVFHARRLRLHELALRWVRWDDVHRRLGVTERFYGRFVPSISTRHFALRARGLDRSLDLLAVLRVPRQRMPEQQV